MNQLHLIKAIIGTLLLKGIADVLILRFVVMSYPSWYKELKSPDRPIGFLGFQLIAHQNSRQYHSHHHQHRYSWQQLANLDSLLSTVSAKECKISALKLSKSLLATSTCSIIFSAFPCSKASTKVATVFFEEVKKNLIDILLDLLNHVTRNSYFLGPSH